MRTLTRMIGFICLFISILFFLYGSIEIAKEAKEKTSTVQMAPDIEIVKNKPEKKMAQKGFILSGIFFISGSIILAFGFKIKK